MIVLVTPGASATRDHPTLVALEAGLPVAVERRDLPRTAPRAVAAIEEMAREIVDAHGADPADLVLGGRSFGGRCCSMAVAGGVPARGLVLISYPLHPPGKPERLRTEHFPEIDVPCLFVSGTRDPFGTPDELVRHTGAIPAPVTHVWIDGGRHDLRGRDDEVVSAVGEWISGL